ncbi:putative quinol monooxygenase [Novosphingobium sp.]|uniref:putative quinol monooxygenase n=1 Tax=Novosphingobium sp. TaxID=1874826 RepID=UPI002FE1A0EC
MITEVAHLTIDPAQAEAFETAVTSVASVFRAAPGCHGMSLEREIEDPSRYRLMVRWETVDAHMVDFRNSPAFQLWRDAAGGFFKTPPVVIHSQTVSSFF